MLIDTHCHLQFSSYKDDRDEVIKICLEKGVVCNVVGTQQSTSAQAVELAKKHEGMYATVGMHPIHGDEVDVIEEGNGFKTRGEEFDPDFYDALIRSSDKVIAIGETGLDAYHVPRGEPLEKVLDRQWGVFVEHTRLAERHGLPLVIHVRDAHEVMIRRLNTVILSPDSHRGEGSFKADAVDISNVVADPKNVSVERSFTPVGLRRPPFVQDDSPPKGVIHCFTGNWEQAQEYLNLGFYLGFTGVVTFPPKKTDPKPQEDLLEVVQKVPLDRILVETDAPFLAPQKYRGERCEPWMVEEVNKFFAEKRALSVLEMERIAMENAKRLFAKLSF